MKLRLGRAPVEPMGTSRTAALLCTNMPPKLQCLHHIIQLNRIDYVMKGERLSAMDNRHASRSGATPYA